LSTSDSTNLDNGSIKTAGGISVARNITVGGDIKLLNGNLITKSIKPLTSSETIGEANNKYSTIYADKIIANTVEGTLAGNISGTSNSATSLASATNFKLEGDVSSNVVSFNGTGNLNKVFNTTLTSNIISNKSALGDSKTTDELLIYRASAGLRKITKETFIGDSAVPIGSIFPYAGVVAPEGYLLCDGSEYEEYRFRELANVIGSTYNDIPGLGPLKGSDKSGTFRVPDMRGRLPLGKQDMNAGTTIPFPGGSSSPSANTPLSTPRVDDPLASQLGKYSGNDSYVIQSYNIPDHDHDMKGRKSDNTVSGSQFYAVNELTTAPNDFGPTTIIAGAGQPNTRRKAGTVTGGAQSMASSGLVRISIEDKRTPGQSDSLVGRPFNVMNPYMTLNYIIRSGIPTND
jgi:microcystin-dependent protein